MIFRLSAVTDDTIQSLDALKDILKSDRRQAVLRHLDIVKKVSQQWFAKGTKGFRPSPDGELRTKGLNVSILHEKKKKTFVVLWHRLANLYHNFKNRKRIKFLNTINRLSKRFMGASI